jgi:hypothetical protein
MIVGILTFLRDCAIATIGAAFIIGVMIVCREWRP